MKENLQKYIVLILIVLGLANMYDIIMDSVLAYEQPIRLFYPTFVLATVFGLGVYWTKYKVNQFTIKN